MTDAINAMSLYSSYLNDFEWYNNEKTSIGNHILRMKNEASDRYFNVDTINMQYDYTFKFNVRLANRHSGENKHYTYIDNSGNKRKITATECGVVWNFRNCKNYYAVVMLNDNTINHDILDKNSLNIKIVKVCDGKEYILKKVDIDKNINLNGGFNLVRIVYDGSVTSVGIGNKSLSIIAELADVDYSGIKHFGYFVGKGACVDIERIVLNTNPTNKDKLKTKWTFEAIRNQLLISKDKYEGYWSYLDRNMDENQVKLGGKYCLALIKNGLDYDILYVNGAKVNDKDWSCGMLKGRLLHTDFVDNYNLIWYDVLKDSFNDDEYATFDGGNIMTLYFPLQKSQLRFYKKKEGVEP